MEKLLILKTAKNNGSSYINCNKIQTKAHLRQIQYLISLFLHIHGTPFPLKYRLAE